MLFFRLYLCNGMGSTVAFLTAMIFHVAYQFPPVLISDIIINCHIFTWFSSPSTGTSRTHKLTSSQPVGWVLSHHRKGSEPVPFFWLHSRNCFSLVASISNYDRSHEALFKLRTENICICLWCLSINNRMPLQVWL